MAADSGATLVRRVSIDLTPLLPGGDNGGAKLVARALVEQFSRLAPSTHFTLLTSAASHAELADLDAHNVQRTCVDADVTPHVPERGALGSARLAARTLVDTLLPASARGQVKDGVWRLFKRYQRGRVARALPTDLHFCPFTAPLFFDPAVPLVSLVHDLQYLEYPAFFAPDQRAGRHEHFVQACQRARRLICVSDFVRQTVLANSRLPPRRVQTIHSTVLHATREMPDAAVVADRVLERLGLAGRRYLLYPANVWPHKNHRRLLEGFAGYLRACPDSDLALVCTGAPGPAADALVDFARGQVPADRFAFAGYLPEPEFAALLRASRAVIFPSLYEGFGLPVLEAMACQRPVLCSNVTSLPEIAGDAALLFDPRQPAAIGAAIGQLEGEPELEAQLVARGQARVRAFGTPREMAARYLAAFEEVVTSARAG